MRKLKILVDGTGQREEYSELSAQEEQALRLAQGEASAEEVSVREQARARIEREAAIDRLLAERKEHDAR